MSQYSSTTATSMSGVGYSISDDYSDLKQKLRKESLGRLAETYRQRNQALLGRQSSADSVGSLSAGKGTRGEQYRGTFLVEFSHYSQVRFCIACIVLEVSVVKSVED
jgi:hypothetical protein